MAHGANIFGMDVFLQSEVLLLGQLHGASQKGTANLKFLKGKKGKIEIWATLKKSRKELKLLGHNSFECLLIYEVNLTLARTMFNFI